MRTALIKETWNELLALLVEFNRRWPEEVIAAEVYPLPLLPKQMSPEHIEPGLLCGDEAVAAIKEALVQLYYTDGQHPSTVFRLPGWVALKASLEEEIAAINQKRDTFRALITELPPGSRAAYTREVLKGISKLQSYRHLFYLPTPPRRLLFTWAGNTTAHSKTNVRAVLDRLEESRGHPPGHLSIAEWNYVIDMEWYRMATMKNDMELLYRKPVAPHPRMTSYPDEGSDHDHIYHANLPLLFTTPGPLPEVERLPVYDSGRRRKKRRDHGRYNPVIDRIHLYATQRRNKRGG